MIARAASFAVLAFALLAPAAAQTQDVPSMPIDGFLGCRDWDTLTKIIGLSGEDREAAKKATTAAVLTGQCVLFMKGEKVFLVELGMFTQSMQLRPAGETLEYWTTRPNSIGQPKDVCRSGSRHTYCTLYKITDR